LTAKAILSRSNQSTTASPPDDARICTAGLDLCDAIIEDGDNEVLK
jgi:hypothetical protein